MVTHDGQRFSPPVQRQATPFTVSGSIKSASETILSAPCPQHQQVPLQLPVRRYHSKCKVHRLHLLIKLSPRRAPHPVSKSKSHSCQFCTPSSPQQTLRLHVPIVLSSYVCIPKTKTWAVGFYSRYQETPIFTHVLLFRPSILKAVYNILKLRSPESVHTNFWGLWKKF